MDEQDSIVPFNVQAFYLNVNTISCIGQLNWVVLCLQHKTGIQVAVWWRFWQHVLLNCWHQPPSYMVTSHETQILIYWVMALMVVHCQSHPCSWVLVPCGNDLLPKFWGSMLLPSSGLKWVWVSLVRLWRQVAPQIHRRGREAADFSRLMGKVKG